MNKRKKNTGGEWMNEWVNECEKEKQWLNTWEREMGKSYR